MDDLKPCPFCGSKAELIAYPGKFGWFVYCECTFCRGRGAAFHYGKDLLEDWGVSWPAERAAEAWNRRM